MKRKYAWSYHGVERGNHEEKEECISSNSKELKITIQWTMMVMKLISLIVLTMVVPKLDVKSFPTAEEIQQRVNDRYDELFHTTNSKEWLPYVCSICNEFLLSSDTSCFVTISKMKKMEDVLSWCNYVDECRSKAIEEYF